jgi:hypothetical protein
MIAHPATKNQSFSLWCPSPSWPGKGQGPGRAGGRRGGFGGRWGAGFAGNIFSRTLFLELYYRLVGFGAPRVRGCVPVFCTYSFRTTLPPPLRRGEHWGPPTPHPQPQFYPEGLGPYIFEDTLPFFLPCLAPMSQGLRILVHILCTPHPLLGPNVLGPFVFLCTLCASPSLA